MENFKQIVKEANESEPVNKLGLKFIGLGADSIVFETPGSEKKVIKVNIEDIILGVMNSLNNKSDESRFKRRVEIINESKSIENELIEIFGKEHLLKRGYFKTKVPITKKTIESMLVDNQVDENILAAINKLTPENVLQIETVAETQIKSPELLDHEKFNTLPFNSGVINARRFYEAGNVDNALESIRELINKNFIESFNKNSFNPKQIEAVKKLLEKIIEYTKKTGLMIDIFGPGNIIIFTKENGDVDYRLVDVILPGQQHRWVKNIKDDPKLDLLRHYYSFYYSIKELVDKLGLKNNLVPEDLVYFKNNGLPTQIDFNNIK